MMYKLLKITRVSISLVFLFILTFAFVDFSSALSEGLLRFFSHIQLVPAVIHSFYAAGALIILTGLLLLALLLGRVYCSTLCPLGVLQDVLSFISRKTARKKKIFRYSKPHNWLRYLILGLTVTIALSFGAWILSYLDPYSVFGKIVYNLGRPVYIWINNLLAIGFEKLNWYSLYHVDIPSTHWTALAIPAVLFLLVAVLAWRKGRLYCNTVCPVGSLLGLISKISVFKIAINETACTRCGKCSVVCKSGCIDVKTKQVDFSRCVGCFNCLKACDQSGISYRFGYTKPAPAVSGENPTKRDFLKALVVGTAGTALFSGFSKLNAQYGTQPTDSTAANTSPQSFEEPIETRTPNVKTTPVTPPGSLGIAHFTSACTACHLCISACPTGVIRPSFLEYGLTGMLQPYLDFEAGFCNYECVRCSEVCPTGAILSLTVEAKKTTQTGLVQFKIGNCIVYLDGTSCGACAEHCPTTAVKMVDYKDGLTIPHTTCELCIGCGACEHVCPADPKAIYVDGNTEHLQAKLPDVEAAEMEETEEFPF